MSNFVDTTEPYRSLLDQSRDFPTADELRGKAKESLHALAQPVTLEYLEALYALTKREPSEPE